MKNKIFAIGLVLMLVSIFTGCVGTTEKESIQILTQDEQMYKDALENSNEELCGLIKNEILKRDCLKAIEDDHLYQEATVSENIAKCNQIESDTIKEKCKILLTGKEKETKKYEKAKEELAKAEVSGNIQECESLEYEHHKTQCKIRVYMDLAQKEKDPSICDNIESQETRELCQEAAVYIPEEKNIPQNIPQE